MSRRVLSIASAPGWSARLAAREPGGDPRTVVLAAWSLLEDDGGATELVGFVQFPPAPGESRGRLGPADEVEGFLGYTFTGLATRPSPFE
jgi:hypothetical protein